MVRKCDRCGRNFLSTKRFVTIEEDSKEILVCPHCNNEINTDEKEKKRFFHDRIVIEGF